MPEKIVLIFYSLVQLVIALYMLATKEYIGELELRSLKVDDISIVLILGVILFGYILLYYFYKKTAKIRFSVQGKTRLIVNKNRLDVVFLSLTLLQLIFLLCTGVGRIGSTNSSSLSSVVFLFNVNPLFPFYYFLCRKNGKLYFVNILLFCALELLRGWSSFLLVIFFFECFFFFKNRKSSFTDIFKISTFSVLIILVGGKLYQYVYSLKNFIRFGYVIENTFWDGVVRLLARIAYFPIAVGAYQNWDIMKAIYLNESINFIEIRSFLRPLVPSFVFNKDFRGIGNIIINSYYDVDNLTSSSFGLFMYGATLCYIDIKEALVWLIALFVLFIITKVVIDLFEQYNGQLSFVYFMQLLSIYHSGSLEISFSYHIFPVLFIFPLLYITKTVKIIKVIQ